MEDLNYEEDGRQILTVRGDVLDMSDLQYHKNFHIWAQSMSLEHLGCIDSAGAGFITPHGRESGGINDRIVQENVQQKGVIISLQVPPDFIVDIYPEK